MIKTASNHILPTKNKVLVALYFGMVAHFAISISVFIVGITRQQQISWDAMEILGSISWMLLDPIFWSGAISGYILGEKICITHTESQLDLNNSILVGLAITLLASAILGLFGGISSVVAGKSGIIDLLLSPLIGVFSFALITLGMIYVVGCVSALLLHVGSWAWTQLNR